MHPSSPCTCSVLVTSSHPQVAGPLRTQAHLVLQGLELHDQTFRSDVAVRQDNGAGQTELRHEHLDAAVDALQRSERTWPGRTSQTPQPLGTLGIVMVSSLTAPCGTTYCVPGPIQMGSTSSPSLLNSTAA